MFILFQKIKKNKNKQEDHFNKKKQAMRSIYRIACDFAAL
jgi:hypothetical protein